MTYHMRSSVTILTLLVFLLLFTGCSGDTGPGAGTADATEPSQQALENTQDYPESPENAPGKDKPPIDENSSKILIVYFSHTGNTENMANLIHGNTGGDLFEIMTVDPYPEDYDACVAQARQEKTAGYRPALSTAITDMDSYSIVFFGYPCWISTMPMACFTFLETYDMSGKTVIPFSSYGGTGWGESLDDIKSLCPDSTILEGLAVRRDGGNSLPDEIEKWLKEIGMI